MTALTAGLTSAIRRQMALDQLDCRHLTARVRLPPGRGPASPTARSACPHPFVASAAPSSGRAGRADRSDALASDRHRSLVTDTSHRINRSAGMPKQVDHESRRRQIADAVCRLADERGLEGVTLRDVAARAKVSMGAVQRCFRTKEEMLVFALSHIGERIAARVTARLVESPAQSARRRWGTPRPRCRCSGRSIVPRPGSGWRSSHRPPSARPWPKSCAPTTPAFRRCSPAGRRGRAPRRPGP